ncbi:MAG: hypothetical protein I3273_02440 [Candidatus Moeniiplasma glomeromycotorum]|nr:hypothetical protein [Candidatus Moeniiplasma glomeromycotorum]MCE8167024.1 hypothetical protein [Candidatus Moeniiplasma glomeromycotorum]MCE8168964.1 hypothetical protein [Candidatus Moeniiplasma glomeromycotorum]
MIQTSQTKIVLLLLIPIVNHFNFSSEKCRFFDLSEVRKKWLSEKKNSTFSKERWLELLTADHGSKIEEVISQEKSAKVVIINYPSSEKQFDSFQQVLNKQEVKVDQIILLIVPKYELILNLKNEYLICPICEKTVKREVSIQDLKGRRKVFVCPQDKEYQFSLPEIEQFNEWIIDYYLSNTKKVVEKFLKEKITFTQIVIKQPEDIFLGKIQTEILKIIENL